MFTTSLPLLPPSSSSLFPPLHVPPADPQSQNSHNHPNHRRPKYHVSNNRSSLAYLSLDERTISQRKLAIAMYGYSWLKPAGCTKTMLGRREEEIEREEVERQLQEVEMQDRNAAMAEEQERLEALRRQGEEGGEVGVEERDLDDEVPDMDAEGQDEDEELEEEEQDMDGDLDDEVPDADAVESSWVYDTNRDPDTESEEEEDNLEESAGNIEQSHMRSNNGRSMGGAYLGMENAAETEAMINAMLDEDELGELEHDHDLDDDLPDMDMDIDMDAEAGDHDLDDDVPEADEEGEWQHTDTELEESEMDISILPPGSTRSIANSEWAPVSATKSRKRDSNVGAGTTHEEMRRVSGNIMMPPPPHLAVPQSHSQYQERNTRRTTRNMTPQYQTPGAMDSVSNLISTDGTNMVDRSTDQSRPLTTNIVIPTSNAPPATTSTTAEDSMDPQRSRRSWLNPAGARRNLFGGLGRGNAGGAGPPISTSADESTISTSNMDSHSQNLDRMTSNSNSSSSGGLFTPAPRIPAGIVQAELAEDAEPRSRTRSGRLLGGIQVGRRGRRRGDET